jgi:hypothetical protein
MTDGEEVVWGFFGVGESADRPFFSQGGEHPGSAGEHFVGVALMADIPKERIGPRGIRAEIVNVVECDGQFGDAKIAGEVTAVFADGLNDAITDFCGEDRQLFHGKTANICRNVD